MTNTALSAPALSVFSFESSYQVRVIIKCNEPWFCLRDVCAVLDIQNNSQLSKQLDTKGISKTYTPTNGGKQQLIYVNEPNLYRVIFRSNKPEARRFQDWVFNEVLPTIRRTGQYIPGQPPTSERLSHQDMLNIRRTFWAVADRFDAGQAWSNALWKCLRDVTGRASPLPFYVEDLPAIEKEIKRIGSILCPLREAIYNAKKTALKRVIRNREDADKVLAEIEKTFKEESEFRWIPDKIENDCFNRLLCRKEPFLPIRDGAFVERIQ